LQAMRARRVAIDRARISSGRNGYQSHCAGNRFLAYCRAHYTILLPEALDDDTSAI
jgi:hypothetical protein